MFGKIHVVKLGNERGTVERRLNLINSNFDHYRRLASFSEYSYLSGLVDRHRIQVRQAYLCEAYGEVPV